MIDPETGEALTVEQQLARNVYIPKEIGDILDDMMKMPSQRAGMKAARGATKVFKAAVMSLSLKHMAHVLFGGFAFLAGRGGLDSMRPSVVRRAWEMARKDPDTGLRGMTTDLPELAASIDIESPAELTRYNGGKKLGKAWNNTLGKLAERKWNFDEFVINFQRSMTYLGEEKRALRAGMSRAEAQEAGLRSAQRTLVDLDSMNAVERNTLRQVMPFYAFMRHTLRYVLTYPIDHPLRASILSHIYNIEAKDWSSGLPQQLQSMMMIGAPGATGEQLGIEMRQFNPFRDTGDYFTWAGFLKAVNPLLAVPFEAMGVDKFTGTTPLYPQAEIDPKTGNLIAKRPPNLPWNVVTSIIPEAQLADLFGGFTTEMREMKKRDPEAFRRRIFQSLFIPFEPRQISRTREAADIQRNLLAIAGQDVSNALRTGDTSKLKEWPLIPYQGQLIEPKRLIAVLELAKKRTSKAAPRALIPQVEIGG